MDGDEELDFLEEPSPSEWEIKSRPENEADSGGSEMCLNWICALFCHSVNFIQLLDFYFHFVLVGVLRESSLFGLSPPNFLRLLSTKSFNDLQQWNSQDARRAFNALQESQMRCRKVSGLCALSSSPRHQSQRNFDLSWPPSGKNNFRTKTSTLSHVFQDNHRLMALQFRHKIRDHLETTPKTRLVSASPNEISSFWNSFEAVEKTSARVEARKNLQVVDRARDAEQCQTTKHQIVKSH